MANTLNDLIPDLYASLDVVSRELVGMIPSVTIDADVNRAAKDQAVRVAIAPENTAGFDVTPAMTVPSAADQTIGNTSVTINKVRGYPFSWNGSEQRGLDNNGAGYDYIRRNQMTQAMRALVNEMESDLTGLHTEFSRAYGTPSNTPFATSGDFTDASRTMKILKDNGAPVQDNHLVIDTAAGANLGGKQSNSSVEFDEDFLRQGVFRSITGMDIRESGQIVTTGGGTVTDTTVTGANSKGDTEIGVTTAASTGEVDLSAGDVITIAGDDSQYVVAEDVTIAADATGTITITAPGLREATSGSEDVDSLDAAARNMAFNRSAIVLAQRLPERPREGDMAIDVTTITDPRSGLSFEVAVYPGQRMVRYEISAAWGVRTIKPEHTALLLG